MGIREEKESLCTAFFQENRNLEPDIILEIRELGETISTKGMGGTRHS
jgi:hypothetical protein